MLLSSADLNYSPGACREHYTYPTGSGYDACNRCNIYNTDICAL